MKQKRSQTYSTTRIRAWRSDAPPPVVVQPRSGDYGIRGNSHFHPRGVKHKGMKVNGVKVK